MGSCIKAAIVLGYLLFQNHLESWLLKAKPENKDKTSGSTHGELKLITWRELGHSKGFNFRAEMHQGKFAIQKGNMIRSFSDLTGLWWEKGNKIVSFKKCMTWAYLHTDGIGFVSCGPWSLTRKEVKGKSSPLT